MASAEEYAQWIVSNQDKKGTPEFDTVAKAYTIARQSVAPAQQPEEQPGIFQRGANAMLEGLKAGGPVGAMISGAGEGLNVLSEGINKAAYVAGDKASEAATALGASPEVAGGVGTAVNTGIQAVPMIAGGEAAKLASPAFQSTARDLMQSALKPTLKALRTGKAATAIDTLLNEGVNVTQGGVFKLKSKISDLNREISQAIGNSPATISKQDAAKELLGLTQRFQKQVNPNADVAAIRSVWDEFLNHPLLANTNDIPVPLAQQMKQGTYRALSDKYGELGSASTEAQKTLARGLKDEIAKAVPGISGLNSSESKLLDALSVTERRVLMDANKNPAGLSWLATHPGAFAGFMADRSPLFKSLIARILNSGSEQIPANAARLGVGVTTIDR